MKDESNKISLKRSTCFQAEMEIVWNMSSFEYDFSNHPYCEINAFSNVRDGSRENDQITLEFEIEPPSNLPS